VVLEGGIDAEADVARGADIAADVVLGQIGEQFRVFDRPDAVGDPIGPQRAHRAHTLAGPDNSPACGRTSAEQGIPERPSKDERLHAPGDQE